MKRSFLFVLIFFSTFFFLYGDHILPAEKFNVLIIHTYHHDFRWTKYLEYGISDRFELEEEKNSEKAYYLYVEYLDSIRGYPGNSLEYHFKILKEKYKDMNFDIIITADDFAVSFIKEYHDILFDGVPVVFCGLDNMNETFPYTTDWITGIYQKMDIEGNLKLIRRLHPDAETINVFVDTRSVTANIVYEKFLVARENLDFEIKWNIIKDKNVEEFPEIISRFDKKSATLLLSANYNNEYGEYVRFRDAGRIITEYSPVPVYATWTFHINDGVVGGIMESSYIHGKNAAELAIRIINGEKPSDIQPFEEVEKEILFNYDQLVKFGIPFDKLPENSVILDKPLSIFEVFPELSMVIVFSTVFLIVIIIVLTVISRIQKKHNDELRIIEKRYSSLFFGMFEGVARYSIIFDDDGSEIKDMVVINANNSFREVIEYRDENIIGKSFSEIGDYIEKLDFNLFEFLKKAYQGEKTLQSSELYSKELDKWYMIKAYSTEKYFVTSIINDITQLKKKELEISKKNEELNAALEEMGGLNQELTANQEELENLVELLDQSQERLNLALIGSNEGMWDWEIRKGTYYATDLFYSMLGYMKNEISDTFISFKELVYSEDRPLMMEELKKHLTGENDFYSIQLRILSKNGEWKWIHSKGRVSKRDSIGRPVRMTGVHIDISKEKEREKMLEQANELIKESSVMKENFLANISHELRTPMNGIIGMTKLLSSTSLNEEQKEYIDMIATAAKSLMAAINGILDISKIEARKIEINLEKFQLRKFIESVYIFIKMQVNTQKVEFSYSIDRGIPDSVIGDEGNLRIILNNLLSNAIKFTEKGYVKLLLKEISSDVEETVIKFSVEDSGIGVPKEKQQKIFDPFTQADGSTTRKYGGTGLGLTISKRLVELMGGRLWVQSIPGKGSKFNFTLKLKKEGE